VEGIHHGAGVVICRRVFAAVVAATTIGLLVTVPSPAAAAPPSGCDFARSTKVTDGQKAGSRPVVLVHGWTGAPMEDTAKALRNQFGDRIRTFVYDYSHWSSYWASDEHIAPCLAYYLGQVSAEYEKAGGDKKVIVVAHSMGGLATRYALADGAAAKPPLATVVPYIITLGTPSLGSPWGGTMFSQGKEYLQKVFGAADPPGASGGDCLARHEKGQALPKNCGDLPPWLPSEVQLTQIAGDITVDRSVFGLKLYSIPLSSDGIVSVPSAHGYPTSGPSGTPPGDGAKTASRSDTCRVDFAHVKNAIVKLGLGRPDFLVDYVTLKDLQADRFGPSVMAYLGASTFTAACSHIHLPVDQSALNQVTETIKGALAALAQPPATKVMTVTGVTKAGDPASGFTVDASHNPVEMCSASPTSTSESMVSCSPSAAGADVCWIKPDRRNLLCGTDPWAKKLLSATSDVPIGQVAPLPGDPEPWGLVLADGARCRLRNGGAWDGRADDYVGAYYCDHGESEFVLIHQQSTGSAVNRSSPAWTVQVGPMSADNAAFPPPKTMRVATAYFPGVP
jgi:pimeloyl-ACP methyl ester carboxylesterase